VFGKKVKGSFINKFPIDRVDGKGVSQCKINGGWFDSRGYIATSGRYSF